MSGAAHPAPQPTASLRLPLVLDFFRRAYDRVVAVRWELLPYAIVGVSALTLRLVALADKPYHHDESEHAWFAWKIVTGQGYHYDPVFHGPLQFSLTALVYLVVGAGDFAARVAPALMGTAATFLPFFLRRQLGRVAALTASVILCVSPSFLYFSRFAREDIYVAFVTLALLVTLFRFLDRPRPWQPSLLLGLLALSFATKETTYITAFVVGTFFFAATVLQALRERRRGRGLLAAPIVQTVASVGRDAWIWAAATFATVYTLVFTSFFTNPRGLQDGLVESISYWLSQQPVNRGDQPWFYYLIVVPGYEWPVLGLGLIGIVAVARRPTLLGCFLVWMFVASFTVYSWASERMPWLVLHIVLPLALLAGLGAQAVWRTRDRLAGRLAIGAATLGAVYTLQAAFMLSFVRPANPRELLVFVQTSQDVPRVRDEIMTLERRTERKVGHPLSLEVDGWGGTGWPWGWYLRDVPVGYPDMSAPDFVPSAQVVLVAEPNHGLVRPHLTGYVGRRFRLRVWWVPEWGRASATDWARWVLWRKTWSPPASMDEYIYLRRDVARLAATGAAG